MIRWFSSLCKSVTSKSLVVEVRGFSKEAEICNRIQDILLVLYKRIETLSVHLTRGTRERCLFSKLYEEGIVVEEDLWPDKDKQVDHCIINSFF